MSILAIDQVYSGERPAGYWGEGMQNQQGIAALQMLNILEDYDLSAMDHNSAEYLHLFVEAKKIAFADRAVNLDGSLVPRALPGSMIEDPDDVAQRSLQIVTTGTITTISGEDIPVQADTLCLHGDTTGTVEIASKVRTELVQAGVEIAPMGSFL